MKIEILDSAKQDLINSYWFYEKQQAGLGNYFLDSINSDIDSLLIYAGIHPIYFDKYYRMLTKRFPFAVYYCITDNIIYVYAILDCRRNPDWAKKRLND
ncbi:type II toxin-antitoxin system RelE/ParE family toxin [Bacteroidota bacterium]